MQVVMGMALAFMATASKLQMAPTYAIAMMDTTVLNVMSQVGGCALGW